MASTRFRYLPTSLHAALHRPLWCGVSHSCFLDEPPEIPFIAIRSDVFLEYIDLLHPIGWDIAVRALAGIKSKHRQESASVSFTWDGADRPRVWGLWVEGLRVASYREDMPIPCEWHTAMQTTQVRQGALCRAICQELHLDVASIFPLTGEDTK